MSKTALIIGNGPSAKKLLDFGFHNIPDHIDTFATSCAFKYCEEINWWPTYYVLSDRKITFLNQERLSKYISDPNNPVKKWFLSTDWHYGLSYDFTLLDSGDEIDYLKEKVSEYEETNKIHYGGGDNKLDYCTECKYCPTPKLEDPYNKIVPLFSGASGTMAMMITAVSTLWNKDLVISTPKERINEAPGCWPFTSLKNRLTDVYDKVLLIGIDHDYNNWDPSWFGQKYVDTEVARKFNLTKRESRFMANIIKLEQDVSHTAAGYFYPGYLKKGDYLTVPKNVNMQKTDYHCKSASDALFFLGHANAQVFDFGKNNLGTPKYTDIGEFLV